MPMELKVPSLGESITEVTIGALMKSEGESVEKDENVLEIESEKSAHELNSPIAGVVTKILKKVGEKAAIGETVAIVDESATPTKASPKSGKPTAATAAAPKAAPATGDARVMPAAKRAMAETGVTPAQVQPTGPGGRTLKEDVIRAASTPGTVASMPQVVGDRATEIAPMSTIRQTIARRLVEAQSTAALLTTFNEIDMSGVMNFRKKYQDDFTKQYGVKLGFMSFFVKATVDALRRFPNVNAQIKGTDVIYHNYFDIGIAVGGGKGLVVPILRNAERMSFSEIEKTISDFGARAKENAIKMDELTGGTFTISNGGIYGSMLSTPIVNPPQSAILGMHNIVERPVVRDGQIVIRPIMYLALTYDHRIIDGREAVSFLLRIKDGLEDPARLFVEV